MCWQSAHREATLTEDDLTGDIGGNIRTQIHGQACQFFAAGHLSTRNSDQNLCLFLRGNHIDVGKQCWRFCRARAQSVHANAECCGIQGSRTGKCRSSHVWRPHNRPCMDDRAHLQARHNSLLHLNLLVNEVFDLCPHAPRGIVCIGFHRQVKRRRVKILNDSDNGRDA